MKRHDISISLLGYDMITMLHLDLKSVTVVTFETAEKVEVEF